MPAALACTDDPASPSPPPDIVRLDAPVVAALDLRSPLIPTTSLDTAADKLPTDRPEDTSTRTLPVRVRLLWHRSEVSDSHTDRSQPVVPDRAAAVPPDSPTPPPCRVTLTEPDEARLALVTVLDRCTSIVATRDIVPSLDPTVSDCRKLRPIPPPLRHCIEESDPHRVRSHMLPPDPAPPEYVALPSPDPTTVMLVDPVVLPFAAAAALSRPVEMVSISVALPTSLTTVMAADRLARNA